MGQSISYPQEFPSCKSIVLQLFPSSNFRPLFRSRATHPLLLFRSPFLSFPFLLYSFLLHSPVLFLALLFIRFNAIRFRRFFPVLLVAPRLFLIRANSAKQAIPLFIPCQRSTLHSPTFPSVFISHLYNTRFPALLGLYFYSNHLLPFHPLCVQEASLGVVFLLESFFYFLYFLP